MGKVINIKSIKSIADEKKKKKKIVLLGGCFDILHKGHIEFLQKSKNLGDILIVLLESDEKIEQIKGLGRPVNDQKKRSSILSHLGPVDFVVNLPLFESDSEYEKLVKQLEPDIIAVTSGTHVFEWEKEYMRKTGGRIVEVMEKKENYSTTNILQNI